MIPLRNELAGFFKFEAVKEDGTRRLLADWFPNLILDQGLDYLGGNADVMSCCQVGTSSTAPANGQTTLVAFLAGTSTVQSTTTGAQGSAPYYGYVQRTYRFAAGVATGNLSEVGVGKTAATGSLFSRALILDGGGSPTTITVLADEYLDVTYELRQYPPLVDVTGMVSDGGDDYDYVLRAMNVTSAGYWGAVRQGIDTSGNDCKVYSGALGAITSFPAGSSTSGTTPTFAAYTNGNYYRDVTAFFSIAQGSFSVGAASLQTPRGEYQVSFDPVIPKDATKQLTLGFRVSWARKVLP